MIYLIIWAACGLLAAFIYLYDEKIKHKFDITLADVGYCFIIFIWGLITLMIMLYLVIDSNKVIYHFKK